MKLSGFHMPRWWQAAWRARYPMGPGGVLDLYPPDGGKYVIHPMRCGCGYLVRWIMPLTSNEVAQHPTLGVERIGPHRPTLGGAIRQARRHARNG